METNWLTDDQRNDMDMIWGNKSDYSYSTTIVYNNYPWPDPTDSQKQLIESTAQAILDVIKRHLD